MSSLFFVFALAVSSIAQTITPTPTPDTEDVVKISTNLVQIDVTVTDKKGNVVRDLKPSEVEVYENGKKQDVTHFSFISNVSEHKEPEKIDKKTAAQQPVLPPPVVKPEQVHRTIALVVDDLTLSFQSVYYVRQALKKFIDTQMQDGDLVAIVRTGAGMGALQQFTTDKRMLYAAIEKVRWNPMGSGGVSAFEPLQAKVDTGEPTPTPEPGERTAEGIEKENNEERAGIFAAGTLGAINYVVRGMQELPGRKSILLLSDGFKLYQEDADGFKESGRVMDAIRKLIDAANRAAVVIYTMDARGLQYTGLTAADDTSGRSSQEIDQEMSDRRDQLFDTQAGLQFLAQETGGTAFVNNNDLSGGIRKILDDQSYYLVGYDPDENTFDAKTQKFNRIQIKVLRPDVIVRYRKGFYGVTDDKVEAPPMTASQQMAQALTSPFGVNDIALRLNALFGNDAKIGSYIRSFLHVSSRDMTFSDGPDNTKKAVFEIIAVGFGDNGTVVDQLSRSYTLTVKKDQYDKFLKNGFVYDFTFPIKKPGSYQLRVALRDSATGKLGSANQFVEVTDLKKNKLALSGVVLEDITVDEYKKRDDSNANAQPVSDTLTSTSVRQFQRGTILNYGFVAFNAKTNGSAPPSLTSQTRLYRDGKMIYEGKPQSVSVSGQSNPKAVNLASSLVLGTNMAPGDYILALSVTDNLSNSKNKTATQFVQFEIVE